MLEIRDDQRPFAPSATGRRDARQGAVAEATADLGESCARVARQAHMPTREGMMACFGRQLSRWGL